MTASPLDSFYASARKLEPSEELLAHVLRGTRRPDHARAPRRRVVVRRRALAACAATISLLVVATALGATLGIVHLSNPGQQLIDANAARTTGLPGQLGAPEATHLYCRVANREIEAPVTGADPTAACAALWRQGVMTGTKQAPPVLQACVATTGVITVYPGANACAAIGRPVALPYTASDLQAIKLSNALMDWVNGTPRGCVTISEGTAKINALLQQMGLANSGWQIATDDQASNGDDGTQCVVPTVFEAKKTIVLD
jgi:hypothetical protein